MAQKLQTWTGDMEGPNLGLNWLCPYTILW
jgi:hypothetical protein